MRKFVILSAMIAAAPVLTACSKSEAGANAAEATNTTDIAAGNADESIANAEIESANAANTAP